MTCKNFANRAIAILLSVVMLIGMIPAVGISADESTTVIFDISTLKFALKDQHDRPAPEGALEYIAPTAGNPVLTLKALDPAKITGGFRYSLLSIGGKSMAGNHILKLYYKGYDNLGTPFTYQTSKPHYPIVKTMFSAGNSAAELAPAATGEDNGWKYIIVDYSDSAIKKDTISGLLLKTLDICPFSETVPAKGALTFPLTFEVARVGIFSSMDDALADHMPRPLHTVTYYNPDGTVLDTKTVEEGETLEIPETPEAPEGKPFFMGWYDAVEGGNLVDDATTVSGDMNIYPRFEIGNKIIFKVDGAEDIIKYVSPNATVLAPEDYPADPANEDEGIFFAGWATTEDGDDYVKVGETAFDAVETVLYAQFREAVVVTYEFPEDNVTRTHALGAYLKHAEFDADPAMDGMVFMGWALKGTTDIVEDGAFTVTEAVTFVPVFKYEVTFDYTSPADAEAEELIKYYFSGDGDEALVFPEAPAKDGAYEFVEWVDENGDPVKPGLVTKSAAYKAKFDVSANLIEVIYMVEENGDPDTDFIFKKISVPGNEILLGENGYLSNKGLADEINAGPYNEKAFKEWSYTDDNFITAPDLAATPLAVNVKNVNEPVVVVPVFSDESSERVPVYYVTFEIDGVRYASSTSKDGTIEDFAELEAIAIAAEEREFLHFVDEAGNKIDANTEFNENMILKTSYLPIVINNKKENLGSLVGIIAIMKKVKEHNGQPTSAIGSRPYRLYDGDELINTTVTSQYSIKFEDGYVRFAVNADTLMLDPTLIDITFPQNDLVKLKEAPVIVVGYRTNTDKLSVFNGAINLLNENMATTRMWGGEISPSKINNSEQWATAIMNLKGRTFTGGSGAIVNNRTIEQFNAVAQESYHSGWDMRLGDKNVTVSAGTYLDIQYIALFESLEDAGSFVYQPGILDKGEFEAKKAADKKAAEEAAKKAAE